MRKPDITSAPGRFGIFEAGDVYEGWFEIHTETPDNAKLS